MKRSRDDSPYRVQHIHGDRFVLFDQARGKTVAGPGSREEMQAALAAVLRREAS